MRALIALVALGLGGCASGPLFIDQIEDGQAVLIDASGRIEHVKASSLPPDAGEGAWLGDPPASLRPARVAALRTQLAHDDPGGDLTLP